MASFLLPVITCTTCQGEGNCDHCDHGKLDLRDCARHNCCNNPEKEYTRVWALVALARNSKKTVAGTIASFHGKELGTAQTTFTGKRNRRFAEAMLFPVKPYSYPDDDSIDRGFTYFYVEPAEHDDTEQFRHGSCFRP